MGIDRIPSFDELRDWLAVANDTPDIEHALARFAKRYGFEWFTYIAWHETNIRGLSNYPKDWQEHYLADRLAMLDPVIAAAKSARSAFEWAGGRVGPVLSRRQAQFMRDAASVGIRSGISIPVIGGHSTRATLTFSSSQPKADDNVLTDQFTLLSIGAFLHGFVGNLDDIVLSAPDCPLTQSQLQCLSWLVQGKTNAEIAIIRGVSTRAIEYQLRLVREKLDAVTTVQASAIALDRRWIRV